MLDHWRLRVLWLAALVGVAVVARDAARIWLDWNGLGAAWEGAVDTGLLIAVVAGLGWRLSNQVGRCRAAERATVAMAAQYRILAENSRDMIVRMDGSARRLYVSPASRDLVGYEPEALVGMIASHMIHPEDLPASAALLERMMAGQDKGSATHRLRHRDGRWIWVEANLQLLRDPATGAPVEVLATLRDVSARRATEQALADAKAAAERASAAKSEFLASMSHEIRTPLTAILGFASLLADGDLAPEHRRRAAMIQDAGTSLLAIINDILDMSKIEAGKLELERIPISPAAVADAAVSILRSEAAAKGLRLALEVAPDVPDWVEGDPTRLRQVVLNLLSNAVKFTAHGGVRLAIRREPGAPGPMLRFEVCDTGIGIAPDRQDRLFQTFSQVDRTTTRRYGGTGLGLAICKRLVEAMGGAIGVSSVEGSGSVFWFTAALPGVPAPVVRAAEPMRPVLQPARVLVVDDVPVNQVLVETILTGAGHHAAVVDNGAEAVEAVRSGAFDVVVMDIEMPEMDGIDATRAIRGLPAPARDVPIIALTANAMADEIRRCREAGMNDHLSKPVARDQLLRAIAIWARSAPLPTSVQGD